MAIYSLHTEPASRSNGRSAIAMAAYRAGERLFDRLHDKIADYTRKRGIVFKEILCPQDLKIQRQDLWNLAEEAEKRKDARIAREILIALPYELTKDERINLAKNFSQHLVEKYHIAVDLCIHSPSREGDQRNHHAHLLLTTRTLTSTGLGEKSDLERSNKFLIEHGKKTAKDQILEIRQVWENFCNLALERKGLEKRISAKSHKDRKLDIEPTIHVGATATAMERQGINSDRGDINRAITKSNLLHKLQKKLKIALEAASKISRKIFYLRKELTLERTQSQPQQPARESDQGPRQPERPAQAPIMERPADRQPARESDQGLRQPERPAATSRPVEWTPDRTPELPRSASELLERIKNKRDIENEQTRPRSIKKELERIKNSRNNEKKLGKDGLER